MWARCCRFQRPTALALDKAKEAGLKLFARAPNGIAQFANE